MRNVVALALVVAGLGSGAIAVAASPVASPAASPAPRPRAPVAPVATAPAATPAPAPAPPPAPSVAPPPAVVDVAVAGDLPVRVVAAARPAPPATLFLPGICSRVDRYLAAIAGTAQATGGALGLQGDLPCGRDGHRTFAWDAARQHRRLLAAAAAAGAEGTPARGYTLVGYSQGAAIAEQLVALAPDVYPRVVLIGAPTDPSPATLALARAVVTMSCNLDVPRRMRTAAEGVAARGVPARYVEMKGCHHGQLADAETTFADVFAWLEASDRAPRTASR